MRWDRCGNIWLWRDDLYEVAGVRGGKVRTCWALVQHALAEGKPGLVTAGSRHSPQVNIVAQLGAHVGLPVVAFVPAGPSTPELELAAAAGATLAPVRPGHNSVIRARAREYAEANGWQHIPFGMECREAVLQTANAAAQATWPEGLERVVVPVGSGMSLAGILQALEWWRSGRGERTPPVLGVCVGADPTRRLDTWAPPLWRLQCTLVQSQYRYDQHAPADAQWAYGFPLDPVYEAKVVEHLRPGDGFWIVGVRQAVGAPA